MRSTCRVFENFAKKNIRPPPFPDFNTNDKKLTKWERVGKFIFGNRLDDQIPLLH
jgi:hypothetical protein